MRAIGFLLITLSAVLSAQQPPPPAPPQPGGQPGVQQGDAAPDEPGRPVVRLSVLSGDASVRRGDSGDWVAAALNAPLMAGDSVAVSAGGATELQFDNANFLRMAGDTELRLADVSSGRYQIQISKGLVTYRVLRDSTVQSEISTPLVAVRPQRLSAVRVEVAPDGATKITVRHGDVEVYTPKGTERIHEGNMMQVRGSADDPEYQIESAAAPDQWDTWNNQRDAYLMRAQSPRYVSPDVYGSEDLDANGRWSYDPAYGNVWSPNVPSTWAPYRNGQWVWEDYYGWTWVDYDPWGWAPFHYGSWYFRGGAYGWSWFPGSRFHHSWWRPALVGFVGFGGGPGFGVGFGFGNIGWIPLAPFEIFRPWYGRGWFGGGRPLIVNNINIVHNANVMGAYRNARFSNGVTAVSTADFQRGNFRNAASVDRGQLERASLVRGAVPMTPSSENLRFSNRAVTGAPGANMANQRFYSRMPPSTGATQRTPFAQQQAAVHSAFESRGFQTGATSSAGGAGFARSGMTSGGAVQPRGGAAPGWQRFNGQQAPARAPGTEQRQYSAPAQPRYQPSGQGYGGGYSRSLQVAPPIVRQREAAPSYNRGGGNYSAPAYRGGSGGGAPSYHAPAPAPSYHGGGGGGGGHASSGGGHSGGRR